LKIQPKLPDRFESNTGSKVKSSTQGGVNTYSLPIEIANHYEGINVDSSEKVIFLWVNRSSGSGFYIKLDDLQSRLAIENHRVRYSADWYWRETAVDKTPFYVYDATGSPIILPENWSVRETRETTTDLDRKIHNQFKLYHRASRPTLIHTGEMAVHEDLFPGRACFEYEGTTSQQRKMVRLCSLLG
jgi:hypothetical protein